MLCWRPKKEKRKKENVDYILSTEDTERSLGSLLFYETKTIISPWSEKSIFLTQWFYRHSVFNMERHLACPTSLAVFINQDNQYQQNKQEKNIMIKHKWDVKEYFQKYNTNEKHKTIIFFQSNLSAHKESFQICSTLRILKDYKDVLVFWRWTL